MISIGLLAAIVLAVYAALRYRESARKLSYERARIANLQALNALLRTLASSPDITRSLFEIAHRIRAIVACDRVGLAFLTDDRQGYTTYTARLDVDAAPADVVPDLHFPRAGTIIDEVVTSRYGRIVNDVAALAPRYLDANVLTSARFASLAMVPLIFEGEPIGTLNLVARQADAFHDADLDVLAPVGEALSAAYGTRRLANTVARHETANEFAELTFAFANDMNGAVQALIGGCELMARESRDPAVHAGAEHLLQQAGRLRDILSQMQRLTRQHPDEPRGV